MGLSQKELALHLELSRNKIASYESGIVEPNAKVFLKFCQYFEVSEREMLDTLMADHPVETAHIDSSDLSTIDQYLIDQFDLFIAKTNDMTKVLDGYKALLEMRFEQNQNESTQTLYHSFDDLLKLLETLLQTNWDLIHLAIPTEKQSD